MQRWRDDLEFRKAYYNDLRLRGKLSDFAGRIFPGFSFEKWNALGYEFREYTPFSYFRGGEIVANVSASPMSVVINGKTIRAVQIGTVGTLPEYRRRGLIRELMERAEDHWRGQASFDFLFANETSTRFYQQFGFRPVPQHRFTAKAPAFTPPGQSGRKVNLGDKKDRDLLFNLAKRRSSVSEILGVVDHAWLLLFHAATAYRENIVHIPHLDLCVIGKSKDKTLHVVDIIGETPPPAFQEIYPFIATADIETIEFHFTPDQMGLGNISAHADENFLCFQRGQFQGIDEAFRFPATSEA